MNDPLRQAISAAAFWGVSRVRLPFSLLYMALSLGRNIIRSGLLAMVTATEPSNRVDFYFRIIGVGFYVEVSTQHLHSDGFGLYDERMFRVLTYLKIAFAI